MRPWIVMLVDDEPLVQAMTKRWLADSGIELVSALSGAEALAALEARPGVDLVIVDLHMPGMRGDELIVRMRAIEPRLIVLGTTGVQSSSGAEAFAAARPDDFLAKPFRGTSLVEKVTSLLHASRPSFRG